MSDVTLRPANGAIRATVHPPGSKSQTNRALLLGALADGQTQIDGLLVAEDTQLMLDALRGLGVSIAVEAEGCEKGFSHQRGEGFSHKRARATVRGVGGRWPHDEARLFCGNAGTVARFLTAACCVGHGEYVLDGAPRMRERPIAPLVAALTDLGARIVSEGEQGGLPLRIAASGLRGGMVGFHETPSSQFVSALLMAAPLASGDVFIDVTGPLGSASFVRMTLAMMERFGAMAVNEDLQRFIVPGPQRYVGTRLEIEPDATAASYFFAAAALTGGEVTVEGLGRESLQGDLAFVGVLEMMGCRVDLSARATTVAGPPEGGLSGVDVDVGDMPDVAQTLAVLALFAEGPTRIRNAASLRVKETDRLAALTTELSRLGAEVEMHEDGLTIRPPKTPTPAAIETYDDHRMAMSFALAGLRLDGVTIRGAECVNKTYPEFFDEWSRMTGR